MDCRQLEAFVCVVEQKSFSAAAQKLCLTQPTVSAHVRSLEKELHVRLIRRTTKMFEMTAEGRRLYEYAVSILHLQQRAISELSDESRSELCIGASSVPGKCILPQALADYHRVMPDLCFRTFHSDSRDIIQRVSDGRLDAGLVGTTVESECEFIPFATDELVIAAPNTPRYRDLMRRDASLAELLREPFIMREDDSGTKMETERFLSGLNISINDLNVVAYMNDTEALQNCLIDGLGISVISRRMAKRPAGRGELLVFPLGAHRLVRKLYIVYRKDRYLPKNAEDFIGFLKEYPCEDTR